jgi:rhodanese-related sulfurtransferase
MRQLDPTASHDYLLANPDAVLVDCRSEIEFMYVGHPVGAEHIAWQEVPDWEVDHDFGAKVERLVNGNLMRPVLLICRSGQRSQDAGEVLERAGFATVVNVTEGFEGPLDDEFHRGTLGGWRFRGLPWQQC